MKKPFKVLITDDVHPILIEGLTDLGLHCTYTPEITIEEVRKTIHEYKGIVVNTKIKMDRGMIELSPQLCFIARLGSGLETIDTEYAGTKGISVMRSPEGNRQAVAEHALGMVLSLYNHFITANTEMRQGLWMREKNRGREISGSTVGIVGFGHTGQQFAKILSGLDVSVVFYDPYISSWQKRNHIQRVELDELQILSDIISFHVPLTEETQYMCDERFIEKCQKGVTIVNTSRGKVVRLQHLIAALKSGQLGGACLDVFENEHVSSHTQQETTMYEQLYNFNNVVLTPHVAGWTTESKKKISEVLLSKIKTIL